MNLTVIYSNHLFRARFSRMPQVQARKLFLNNQKSIFMKNTIQIQQTGYDHWKITTSYRGKQISCTTTDSISIDNYRSDMDDRERGVMGQTRKQAAQSLRNQIIRANHN